MGGPICVPSILGYSYLDIEVIKKSHGTGLVYKDHGNIEISGYIDADRARFHYGLGVHIRVLTYCGFFGGHLISWSR